MHRRIVAKLLLFSVTICLTACDSTEAPTPVTTFKDSVGVRIIENRFEPDVRLPDWVIEEAPEWAVGSPAGEGGNDLFYVQGVFQLSDGRVTLGNSGTGEVRIYSPLGELQEVFGGFGEGPGEFGDLEIAGILPGDTIVVIDDDLRRFSLIHPDIGFVRSAAVERMDGGHLYSEGLLGAQGLVTYSGFSFSNIPAEDLVDGYYRAPVTYSVYSLDGSFLSELGPFLGPEYNLRVFPSETGVGVRTGVIPFGKSPMAAVSGDRLLLALGDSPEIREFSSDGTLLRIIRELREPAPVTGELRSSWLENRLSGIEDETEKEQIRRQFRDQPFPEFLPAYGNLFSDPHGFIWAQLYSPEVDSTQLFHVFAPDGSLTAQVILPPRFQVRAIGTDCILGVVWDEYDVEYLYRYKLERR